MNILPEVSGEPSEVSTKFDLPNLNHVNTPNEYRKQRVRLETPTANELEALKKEVKELTEENQKLQEELLAREEVMQSLFSFIEANNTPK